MVWSNIVPFKVSDTKRKNVDAVAELEGRLISLENCCQLNPFVKGDVVEWKTGFRNRTYPAYCKQAIVSKVLDSPVIDNRDLEPMDLLIGFIDDDGDYRENLVDHRRFKIFRR